MVRYKRLNLLRKFLSGKTNIEEAARIDKWYNNDIQEGCILIEDEELDRMKANAYNFLMKEITKLSKKESLYRSILYRTAIAASFSILTIGSYWLITDNRKNVTQKVIITKNTLNKTKITPPTDNKAILTLSDGSSIPLDSVGNVNKTKQDNVTLAKDDNGISYRQTINGNTKHLYNTLSVPKGSIPVRLVLSDSTMAWINAASSITYPVAFFGEQRKVAIAGEVYFEVHKNKVKPFIVEARTFQIEVLGTHFNIKSYKEDQIQKTTLFEGSVKVRQGKTSKFLTPGQQACITKDSSINIVKADEEEAMSWRSGTFIFNANTVTEMMNEIARWYDVEVIYDSKVYTKRFSGIVNRNNEISDVLKILEAAGLKFEIKGRTIHVSLPK